MTTDMSRRIVSPLIEELRRTMILNPNMSSKALARRFGIRDSSVRKWHGYWTRSGMLQSQEQGAHNGAHHADRS